MIKNVFSACVLKRSVPALCLALLVVGLAVTAGSRVEASTLVAGNQYNTIKIIYTPSGPNEFTSGAGSIDPSTLDGRALPYLYCVDIATSIRVPGTFTTTDVTTDGKVRGSYVGGSAAAAGQIAWLALNYAPLALTNAQEAGLQAAIWKVQYGNQFTLTSNNNASTINFYNAALTALGSNTAPLNSILWLSPWDDAGRTIPQQGVITSAVVPEPATIASALVGVGMLTIVGRRASRRRLS